jgi:hypothetical protein
MDEGVVKRTQYWNLFVPHTVRAGATGHGESLVDLENYLLPQERARGSGLHSWGVMRGLAVSATTGAAGVTVSPGTALDAAGRTVMLSSRGLAVVEPTLDPQQIEDVPTVPVGPDGLTVATAGAPQNCLLTMTWREVSGENSLTLLHAPWLRLVPADTFADNGDQVVLAALTVDAAGAVGSLTPGPRRPAGTPSGRLELSAPRTSPGPPLSVDQAPAAALAVTAGGDVVLSRLGGAAPVPLLSIAAGAGDIQLGGGLSLPGLLAVGGAATVNGALAIGGPLTVAGALSVAGAATFGGSVAVGPLAGPPARPLHVEGDEVHSGGARGGFSFADRSVGAFVQEPDAGQRWVWYAQDGIARLSSGTDLLTVSPTIKGGGLDVGLDVSRRVRVRQGKDASAGIWLLQSGPNADRAFIGMGNDDHVGFYSPTGPGWGLAMNTSNGSVGIGIALNPPAGRLHVDGSVAIRASGGRAGQLHLFSGVGVDASGAIGIRSSGDVWAGQFDGDVQISGNLSKGGGGFTIDHPLDPGRKYLSHSFVESPDMLNVYTGTVTTGADGLAEIELPAYFEALNQDLTYQLTPIGTPVAVSVAEEVSGNRFTIRSEPGGVRVCWLVTGVRHDRWAEEHRIVPEHDKPETAADRYLHPLLHGAAAEQGILSRPESVPGPASYPASEPVEG